MAKMEFAVEEVPGQIDEDHSDVASTATPDSLFGVWKPETAGKKGLKVLLYGSSGSGKTYMAGTFPRPLFLDLEGGMRSVLSLDKDILRYPFDPKAEITSFGQVYDFYKKVRTALKMGSVNFDTIVIDSLNEMQNLILKNILTIHDASRMYDDQPTISDYGKLARDMQTVVRMFIRLPFHVVFTAIANQREYADEQAAPQFIGKKTGPDVLRMMDIIGYVHTRQSSDGSIEHIVGYENSPLYVSKDRTDKLGSILPNTYAAIAERIN